MNCLKLLQISFFIVILSFAIKAQTPEAAKSQGIEFYKKGDYSNAIRVLKTSVKISDDAQSWSYLGLAYLRNDEVKNSQKAFEKSLQINPKNVQSQTGLAYIFLLKNDDERARIEVRKAIELDKDNYEAHYISGALSYRDAFYNAAYNAADKAIKINPNFANAYLLKSEALAQSYGILFGVVTKSPTTRSELLKEAAENLETYLKLVPNAPDAAVQRERLTGLKYMGEYYASRDSQPTDKPPAANVTPLKILSKPRADYTETARRRQISGTVRLSVLFTADGKIGYVIVFRKLEGGLTEEAIKSARNIKFEPEKRDDLPVPVVRLIEYGFRIG